MDSQNDEPTQPKRLKFARLCLSQNHKSTVTSDGASSVRASTQASNSQISRFFKQSKVTVETQEKIEPIRSNQTVNAESSDCSNDVAASKVATTTTMNCDNDNQPLCSANDQTHQGNKRKHKSKCDKKTDTKSTIKSFFSNELDDSSNDFETPQKIAKKMPKVLPTKAAKSSRSRRKQQPDIRKALSKDDATTNNDYSHLPEAAQLELALAISKAESMNGTTASSKPIDLNVFAFDPINSKSSNKNGDTLNFFAVNRKAKNRFKWNSKCTQLTRRNDDTQKLKVRNKIDEILLNNIVVESNQADQLKSCDENELADYTPHQIHSRHLQRICISERILFELNNCDVNTNSTLRTYYTNNLVEASDCGGEALLKDWSQIPGRDSIYDGYQTATKNSNETDTARASSPEYDIVDDDETIESSSTNDLIDNSTPVTDDKHVDAAGCSQTIRSSPMILKDNENDDDEDEDEDRTLIMDSNDIQSKIDAINSSIRLSQQFCDNFLATDITCQTADVIRAPSPDLFDDEDEYWAGNDVNMSAPIGETFNFVSEEKTEAMSQTITADDDGETTRSGTMAVASGDVIMISSSEGNTNECNTDPAFDSDIQNSENTIIETIELVDSDSENMLKERIEPSPRIQLSQATRKSEGYAMPDLKSLDEEFENIMQSIGCVMREQPTKSIELNKSNDTATEFKKLSFTERLELYEKDMLNGFTADIPVDILNQSQQQLSQESINLSDDEINYSMCNGAKPHTADDDQDDDFEMDVSSPIKFDSPDSNSNSNHMDSEQTLINQSVCNILEKTFEQCASPVQVNHKKQSKSKTLKKFQSETVLATRYGHDTPSTSSASNRILMTPNKNQPKQCSPISQRSVEETRMDLSNDDYHIRLGSLSPKPNYELMDASTLELELRKYGLKPSLSRRQAIICLDYIYNRTHPFMDSAEEDLCNSLKNSKHSSSSTTQLNTVNEAIDTVTNGIDATAKDSKINFNVGFAAHNLVDEKFKDREVNKIFLPSAPRAKKPWCLEPLHIAWHNLITANSDLRKAILLYEPINLVELKKFLKTIDMTFDNRDLIAFLDLHCITFRMNKASKD